jgi:hypothetical protein
VNTSQIGQGILNSSYVDSHPELAAIVDSIPPFLQDTAEDLLNEALQRLGIHDFYTANLMTVSQPLGTACSPRFRNGGEANPSPDSIVRATTSQGPSRTTLLPSAISRATSRTAAPAAPTSSSIPGMPCNATSTHREMPGWMFRI